MMTRLTDRAHGWRMIAAVLLLMVWSLPHFDAASAAESPKRLLIIVPANSAEANSPTSDQGGNGQSVALQLLRFILAERLADYEVTLVRAADAAVGGIAGEDGTVYLESDFFNYQNNVFWGGSLTGRVPGGRQSIGPIRLMQGSKTELSAVEQVANLVVAQLSNFKLSRVPMVYLACAAASGEDIKKDLAAILVARLREGLSASSSVSLGERSEQASAGCLPSAKGKPIVDVPQDGLLIVVTTEEGRPLFPARAGETDDLTNYVITSRFHRGREATDGPAVQADLLFHSRTRDEELSTAVQYVEALAYTSIGEVNGIASAVGEAARSTLEGLSLSFGAKPILAVPALQAAVRDSRRADMRATLYLRLADIYAAANAPSLASHTIDAALDLFSADKGLQRRIPRIYALALKKAGDLAFDAQDYEAAFERFDEALATSPELADILERRGYAAYLTGDFDAAQKSMAMAVARGEATPLSYFVLATIEENGLERLKAGLSKFPERRDEFLSAMLEVAFTNWSSGNFAIALDEPTAKAKLHYALQAVDSALEEKPLARAHLLRGRIRFALAELDEGDFREGVTDFQNALALEEKASGSLSRAYQIVRLELAEALLLAKEYEEALAEAGKFRLGWDPADPHSAVAQLIEAAATYLDKDEAKVAADKKLADAKKQLTDGVRQHSEWPEDDSEQPGEVLSWSFRAITRFSCNELQSPEREGLLQLIQLVTNKLSSPDSPAPPVDCEA